MPAADAIIARDGPVSAPMDYTVPAGAELVPLCITATLNGQAAAGSYVPCVEILTPDGKVLARAVLQQTIAAAEDAAVTWFPGVAIAPETPAAQPVGVGSDVVYYDTPNAGTPLTMATTLLAGVQYVLVVEGTYSLWNTALGEGTPEAEAQFPGSHAGRASTQVGLDADTCFARQSGSDRPLGHCNLLTFSLDGGVTFTHLEPVGGPYAQPLAGHLYRYQLVGQGHALVIKLNDIDPPDNYGKLRFTLQVPSGTGTGSGAGQLVPPSDTTLNGDVLEVVNGLPQWAVGGAGGISTIASPGATIVVTNPAGPTTDIDLPASGVAAGTYGDATHTSRVTINPEGVVTAASAVPIGGISGSGLVKLVTVTLGATGALDTGANAIPAGHGTLIVVILCRSAGAVSTAAYNCTVNGDTGAHYADGYFYGPVGSNGSSTGVAAWSDAGLVIANSATANRATCVMITIPFYDNANWFKAGRLEVLSANSRTAYLGIEWDQLAAINQITFDTASHLLTNSTMVVYGTE